MKTIKGVLFFTFLMILSKITFGQKYVFAENFTYSDVILQIQPEILPLCNNTKSITAKAYSNKTITNYIWSIGDPKGKKPFKIIEKGPDKHEVKLNQTNDNYFLTIHFTENGVLCTRSTNFKVKRGNDPIKDLFISKGAFGIDVQVVDDPSAKQNIGGGNSLLENRLYKKRIINLDPDNHSTTIESLITTFYNSACLHDPKPSVKAILFSDFCEQNLDIQALCNDVSSFDIGYLMYLGPDNKLYILSKSFGGDLSGMSESSVELIRKLTNPKPSKIINIVLLTTGGEDEQPMFINQEITTTVDGDVIANINHSCSSKSKNGKIDVTIKRGKAPYLLTYFNSSDNIIHQVTTSNPSYSFGNLTPGDYKVIISDPDCSQATLKFTIRTNIEIEGIANEICGGNYGKITLNNERKYDPVEYKWSNGATTKDLENVPIGTYTVTVTSSVCSMSNAFTISPITSPAIEIEDDQYMICGTDKTTVWVYAKNRNEPYEYRWSNGSTNGTQFGLSAGQYTLTVTDNKGCTLVKKYTAASPMTITATPAPIFQQGSGTITPTITGGTAPYSFRWSNGATTKDISGLNAGNYTLSVTDADGCSSSNSFELRER